MDTRYAVRSKKRNKIPFVALSGAVLMMVFLFFSVSHQDLYITGNSAWMLWESRFADFYEVVTEWQGSNSANYLPSTYILFAIWLLPLKLMGFEAPATVGTRILPYIWWYKLLPVLFFGGCVYLIYKIAKEMEFGSLKAQWCAFAFATAPIAVYSQFIFSQYDAFTVFFVLLGAYFLLKENNIGFVASFAVAASFKYYALLFFVVLLLLKEKRVLKIIQYVAGVVSLDALYLLVFMRSAAFKQCVFGFNTMEYVQQADFSTILGNVSFMQVAVLALIAWSYFVDINDRKELFNWGIYLCCGMCFALFGLATFHPQWLIMAVPFWTLASFSHKKYEIFNWLDMLFAAVLLLFTFNFWIGHADDVCLYQGVWNIMLNGREITTHIADLIPYHNKDQMYTIVVAMLLIFFLFNHPRYRLDEYSENGKEVHRKRWLLYGKPAVIVALYIIPTMICMVTTMRQDPVVILNKATLHWQMTLEDVAQEQVITARYPVLSGFQVTLLDGAKTSDFKYGDKKCSDLIIEIVDQKNDKVVFETEIPSSEINDETKVYVDTNDLKLVPGAEYSIRFWSKGDGVESCYVATGTDSGDTSIGCYSIINGKRSVRLFSIELHYKNT